jgi:hypothetical protein
MPIAIMEESTGDQQDVSMEWMSSPPVSPQKNGNVLKRKAEEDLALKEKTHEGVEMEVAHDQEVVVDAKERPAVNGTPEDGNPHALTIPALKVADCVPSTSPQKQCWTSQTSHHPLLHRPSLQI